MELFDPSRGHFVSLRVKGVTLMEIERSPLRDFGPKPTRTTLFDSGGLADAGEAVRADELRAAGWIPAEDPSVAGLLAGFEPFVTWAKIRADPRRLADHWSWAPRADLEVLLSRLEAVEPALSLVFPNHVLDVGPPLDESRRAAVVTAVQALLSCHGRLTLSRRGGNEDVVVAAGWEDGPPEDPRDGTELEHIASEWFLARGDYAFWLVTGEGQVHRYEHDGGFTREGLDAGAVVVRELNDALQGD